MNEKEIYQKLAQVLGFYDNPIWRHTEEKPWYFEYFNWYSRVGGIFDTSETGKMSFGELKEEVFNTDSKKIYYLQGIFLNQTESAQKENKLYFVNSPKTVERIKKWIDEIVYKNFDKILGSNGIKKHTIEYSIPICHMIELHDDAAEFIKNFQ